MPTPSPMPSAPQNPKNIKPGVPPVAPVRPAPKVASAAAKPGMKPVAPAVTARVATPKPSVPPVSKKMPPTPPVPPVTLKSALAAAGGAKPPIRPEIVKSDSSMGKKIFIGFIVFLFVLIGAFYGLLLWGLLKGDLSNPLFEALALEPTQLKSVMLTATIWIFIPILLGFLIAVLVRFFQWAMAPATAIEKPRYIKKSGWNLLFLVILTGIFVGLYQLISNAEVRPQLKTGQESMIITDPVNTIGITAPITVKFNIGQKLFPVVDQTWIRQIDWDFESDGKIDASGPEVIHRFEDRGKNDGLFPVKVVVKYRAPGATQDQELVDQRDVIIANEAVIASFTTSSEVGDVPLTVKFSAATSRDPDGAIVNYEWDLDGNGEYEIKGPDKKEVDKVYTKIGDYKVRLRVTGQNNDFAIAEKTISVMEPAEKIRAQIISPDSSFSGLAPLRITFDGGQSFTREGRIVLYEWTFEGEVKPVIGRTIERTFYRPGDYKATLTVENDAGERDQEVQVIHVTENAQVVITTDPVPGENGSITGEVPLEVKFDSTQSQISKPVEWRWVFEGGTKTDSFAPSASHVFRTPGHYEAKLTIVDANGKEYTKVQSVDAGVVKISPKIIATPSAGSAPLKVDFDGSGSIIDDGEIVNYIWEFPGVEPIPYGSKISYEFKQVGEIPVKLTIVTSTGKQASTEMFVSVRAQALRANFTITPTPGNSLEFLFNPMTSVGQIDSFSWDFGDGTSSADIMPRHTYPMPGNYKVVLTVKDIRGVVADQFQEINVTAAQ